jgi:hypothetical protein
MPYTDLHNKNIISSAETGGKVFPLLVMSFDTLHTFFIRIAVQGAARTAGFITGNDFYIITIRFE